MKNKLPDLRKDKGWSQSDLGDYVSVSRQTINAIEKGRYDPSLSLAFKIAHAFGLSIEQVFIFEQDSA
ncbi:helix-turn-helix transcriptional regulator [Acinetobacter sp. C26M]|uniref:helix-turn-helix transcriptional regulator n=1 Tax=unclassified Acinetobacter TaxID=196816 RepID=UPI0014218894|nr:MULTISPECIES: helix-turn-helix transcriptional regulator [unclassified Acinetobacter]NIE98239.1 helix-turn-helix transcriptional regulator [Acinetobacter sp. Tr-809]USA47083.1 helix-turn-helix transcriptional regulator [Acinetobacter sp. C26M]USA50564.1 helix-turn-helix transcriptional regulator [Acinetobacter sp. C26G]